MNTEKTNPELSRRIDTERSRSIRSIIASHKKRDFLFAVAGLCSLLVGLITLLALIIDLSMDGVLRLSWDFLISFPSRFPEKAGILSAWIGSTLVLLVTCFAAIPLGVASAIYLEEYAPKNWLTALIEINISNLAGVPSIIYGLMALGLFVYQFHMGHSILTAGLTLSLLTLPVIIMATREALRAVPFAIREASYALGASKWRTVKDHVLPYSTGGILTGVIIGLSRAIGETAPLITIGALTFIAFLPTPPLTPEFPFINFDWLKDPFTVMPIQMFNWVSRPQAEFHYNAAAAGLILMVMVLGMNGAAIYLRFKFRKRLKW